MSDQINNSHVIMDDADALFDHSLPPILIRFPCVRFCSLMESGNSTKFPSNGVKSKLLIYILSYCIILHWAGLIPLVSDLYRYIGCHCQPRPSAFCLDRAEIPKFLAWAESSMSKNRGTIFFG